MTKSINQVHHPCIFKVVFRQIVLIEDGPIHLRIIDKSPFPRLHFPAILPTYAFFNDTFKEHLETEYEQVLKWVTSTSFKSIFVPNEQGKLNMDVEGCLDKSKFMLDLLSGVVEDKKEGEKYLENLIGEFIGMVHR
jgi:hypothetical protein